MATLVLTAVGTALGGPIGGAVGALIGRSVDARVFRPAAREGPRLTELAVQTSSYGTQIPKLFGTMRVAGTVIWATDLIETRANGKGGKGQPATATYSYAASFAVLLSARAIRRVGRVWAEGRLIRGAAGDWKVQTGFRLHTGAEDQAVDPLIGSAEGDCPAYRGCAYAVFEGLQLAEFGNRIPSLTFEVVADEGPVGAGAIAATLAEEVTGEVALSLDGFAASGGSVAAVLETLGTMSGAWWAPDGARLTMRDDGEPVARVSDEGLAASGDAVRRTRAIAALETVPRTVTVSHYDAGRDYQMGVQRARRPGPGTREERIEAPAVLSAIAAKAMAEGMLNRAELGRVRRGVATGFETLGLAPGACVTIDGEAGVWRIARVGIEAMVATLDLLPVVRAPPMVAASGGRVLASPDETIGATLMHAFEIPALDDVLLTGPRVSVVATGEGAGWRRAALLYSIDDGASWVEAGATARPGTIGSVEQGAGIAPATLVDRANSLVVRLARGDMELSDADEAALDRGSNLALAGDELLQFARAEPLGDARWRLSGLRRGIRGTVVAAGRAGDRFVAIDPQGVATIDLPATVIGRTVRVLATGVGDVAAPVERVASISGVSATPPAPAHLTARRTSDGGIAIAWVRRSRLGWGWPDGVDAPLGEEREAYRVTVRDAAGGETTVAVDRSALVLASASARQSTIMVRQQGTVGLSPAAMLIIGGEQG